MSEPIDPTTPKLPPPPPLGEPSQQTFTTSPSVVPLTLFGDYSLATERPYEVASFVLRAGARLLDFAVHMGFLFVAGVVLMLLAGLLAALRGIPPEEMTTIFDDQGCAIQLFNLLGIFTYQVVLTGWHGSSIGKRLLGLVVLDLSGAPCTPSQVMKREILYLYDGLLFGLVAWFAMSKSPLNQRNGDTWADTVVVFRRSAPPASLRSGWLFAGACFFGSLCTMIIISVPYIFAIFKH